MITLTPDTGCFPNNCPYVKTGSGVHRLVVFPHIRDTLEDVTEAVWCLRWLKRFSIPDCTVFIIGRRRDVPPGYCTEDMAQDYAEILHRHIGPAHILGISLGGLCAQHLAAGHPSYVKSLVLAVSAHKICGSQQRYLQHWVELARNRKWETVYIELARLMHSGLSHANENEIVPYLISALKRIPDHPENFIHSVGASMTHDTTAVLCRLKMPVLFIGGTLDRLFPESIMREAAQLAHGSQLHLIPDTGHGAFDEQKRRFDNEIKAFIKPLL